jgi:hypothetical protein
MNQTFVNHEAYEREGLIPYSSIVKVFFTPTSRHDSSSHPWGVGIIFFPISRREIDEYDEGDLYTHTTKFSPSGLPT